MPDEVMALDCSNAFGLNVALARAKPRSPVASAVTVLSLPKTALCAAVKLAYEMLVQTKAMEIGLIPGVLQYASPEVSEQHYNFVRSVRASRRFAHLADIRNRLRSLKNQG